MKRIFPEYLFYVRNQILYSIYHACEVGIIIYILQLRKLRPQ